MNDRDINHLHPALHPLCQQWLDKCHAQQIKAFITFTWRSNAEQDALYAQGRTTLGKIVTNAKGGQSYHNFTLPGGIPAAKAFDFAIENPDGSLNWSVASGLWQAAIAVGKELGLIWGGDFNSIKDYDHFQLPGKLND